MDDVEIIRSGDINCFETFIEKVERNGTGRKDGVFKIKFDLESLKDNSSAILNTVVKRIETVTSQSILKGNPDNIYQYKSMDDSAKSTEAFKVEASNLSSYSTKTYCSSILEERGINELIQHYFEDEIRNNVIHCNNVDKTTKKLLRQGAALRKMYDQKVTDELIVLSHKKPLQSGSFGEPVCKIDEAEFDENLDEQPKKIQYAAGVVLKRKDDPIFITTTFSLSRIRNILLLLDHFYPGISSSYYYIGKNNSFFPLHVEDASLWSINYLHLGQPKIWFVCPPGAVVLLMYHLSKSKLSLANTSCVNFLGHKTAFPSPAWLKERNIPFKVVVQNVGEAVCLYPDAAHFGFNTGWNIAEAINFGTVSWIENGIQSLRCLCGDSQIHLDIGKIVAAFRPDLLPQWLKGTYTPSKKMQEVGRVMQSALKVPGKECEKNQKEVCALPEEDLNNEESLPTMEQEEQEDTINSDENLKKTDSYIGDKYLECPLDTCRKRYPFYRRSRLENHIQNQHRPLVVKYDLLGKIQEQCLTRKIM